MKLLLVRHAAPAVDEGVPASRWHLSASGRAACTALARALAPFEVPFIASSLKPKAAETAALIGPPLGARVALRPGLHEHEGDEVGWLGGDEWQDAIAKLMTHLNELVLGSETATRRALASPTRWRR